VLNNTQRIVLDFAWIEYIDSSLGVLVASTISARHHRAEIKLAALGSRAQRMLTTANVDQVFEVYDSADEAIKSFRPDPEAATG